MPANIAFGVAGGTRGNGIFPWEQLKVRDRPLCTGTNKGCVLPNTATIEVDGTPQVGKTVTLDTTNSQLDQPRYKVEWDLNGDGTYETQAAPFSVRQAWIPTVAGTVTVGVRFTLRGTQGNRNPGAVVTGSQTFNVAPAPVATKPQTPVLTLDAARTDGTVDFHWQTDPTATSYVVKRGGIVRATQTGTAYHDTGRIRGVTYYYSVTAKNSVGSSVSSNLYVKIP
jgi:hypothetical protein